jgi:outer membrane protein OmpA-like peptidoglycan-associated protein
MKMLRFVVPAACLAGCATAVPPKELVDARSSYALAEHGTAQKYKPDMLHEAKTALDKAEQEFKADPTSTTTRNDAYIADRRAQLAEVEGSTEEALAQKNQSASDLTQVQAAGITKVQGQLTASNLALAAEQKERKSDADRARTQGELDSTRQALATETLGRADAEARAKDAMNKLALAGVQEKQEPRGLVITLPGGVLFASGKSTLLGSAQGKLAQVADALRDEAEHKITVEGHTDSRGSNGMNQALSQRRADSVRDYLVSHGVPADQINAQGFGPSRPVAENSSAEGRANNRRVEIIIKPTEVTLR